MKNEIVRWNRRATFHLVMTANIYIYFIYDLGNLAY